MAVERRSVAGQSTLEYALVLMAFISMVVAMGALWHASRDGAMLERARRYASHSLEEGVTGELLQDVSSY